MAHYLLLFETTIQGHYGTWYNVGLKNQRTNGMIAGVGLAVVGALMSRIKPRN